MSPEKAPWRATVDFTFYGTLEDAEQIDKAVDAAIEEATGLPTEGGHFGRMDRRDVVDGSPLHKLMEAQ